MVINYLNGEDDIYIVRSYTTKLRGVNYKLYK